MCAASLGNSTQGGDQEKKWGRIKMAAQQLLSSTVPKSTKKKRKRKGKKKGKTTNTMTMEVRKYHDDGEAKPKISSMGVEEKCSKYLNPQKIHQKS